MISLPRIYDRLDKCPARFKLLLTDACRDPHFVPDDAQVAGRTAVDEARSQAGFSDSVRSLNSPQSPKGTVAGVSCSSGEQSWEDRSLGHETQLAALATKRELLRARQLTTAGEELLAQVDELMTGNRQAIDANPVGTVRELLARGTSKPSGRATDSRVAEFLEAKSTQGKARNTKAEKSKRGKPIFQQS